MQCIEKHLLLQMILFWLNPSHIFSFRARDLICNKTRILQNSVFFFRKNRNHLVLLHKKLFSYALHLWWIYTKHSPRSAWVELWTKQEKFPKDLKNQRYRRNKRSFPTQPQILHFVHSNLACSEIHNLEDEISFHINNVSL